MKIIPANLEHLVESDYIRGFEFNYNHYLKVKEARIEYNKVNENKLPLYSDFNKCYDIRTGYYVDGTPINNEYHPLHDYYLLKNNGTIYHIETVCRQYYFGNYYTLICRKDGTQSHATIDFFNVNCRYNTVLETIEENKRKYKLLKK